MQKNMIERRLFIMADDVAQVIALEVEGIKFAIKGTLKVASYFLQAMTALFNFSKEKYADHKEKKLEAPGEHDLKDIHKLSNGTPQVIQVDNQFLNEVLESATKNGLRFTKPIDFDATDNQTPICIPAQDFPMFAAILENKMHKKVDESNTVIKAYDSEIRELREKIFHEHNPKKKETMEIKLENMEQARNEIQNTVDTMKNRMENGLGMSFMEYLQTAKGTEFEKDPEKAMYEYMHGVDIAPSFSAKECMQPIRSKDLMPDSKVRFYVPEIGVTVTRNFEIENNIVYSNYSFKTDSGEMYEFTDKDMTKEKWNDEVLPNLFDKAGILENTQCRTFDSKERLEKYARFFNKLTPPSEKKVQVDSRTGELVFSSAEVKAAIEKAVNDKTKGLASANITNSFDTVSFTVPQDKIYMDKGRLSFDFQDKTYRLDGDLPQINSMDGGNITFTVKKSDSFKFASKEGKGFVLSNSIGAEALGKELNQLKSEVLNEFMKTMSKGR